MAIKGTSKAGVVARAQALIAGANKHLTSTTQVTLAGQPLTPAQIVAKLQALVELRTAVDAAKASTQAKVAVEKTEAPSLRALMGTLATYVKATYQNSPDVLADFGLHPKARTPQTVEAKAAAAAKRAATRAARHTVGSQQRKGIKGDVIGITVKPVVVTRPNATAPSSPSAPAASGGTTAGPTPPHAGA